MLLFSHNDTKHILCIIMKMNESLFLGVFLFSKGDQKGIMIHINEKFIINDTY